MNALFLNEHTFREPLSPSQVRQYKFDSLLSREIRGYVNSKEYLFTKGTRMLMWVGTKLRKLGIKSADDTGTRNQGSINLLRHALITKIYDNPNLTSEQRTEVAEQFKHSPGTVMACVRSFESGGMPSSAGTRGANNAGLPSSFKSLITSEVK